MGAVGFQQIKPSCDLLVAKLIVNTSMMEKKDTKNLFHRRGSFRVAYNVEALQKAGILELVCRLRYR